MLSPEQEFYDNQRRSQRWWLLAVVLALAAHVTVVALAIFLPFFVDTKPPEQVVIVDLDGLPLLKVEPRGGAPLPSEVAPNQKQEQAQTKTQKTSEPDTPPPPSQEKPFVKPVKPTEDARIKEPPVAPTETTKQKTAPKQEVAPPPSPLKPPPLVEDTPVVETRVPVSLKPTSVKQKIARDTRLDEEEAKAAARKRQQEEDRILKEKMRQVSDRAAEKQKELDDRQREREEWEKKKQERLATDAAKRAAAAEAKQLADTARRAEAEKRQAEADLSAAQRDLEQAQNAANNASTSASQNAGAGQASNPAIGSMYNNGVAKRLRSYWSLPETRMWDARLSAKVSLTINRQGTVTRIVFDQGSGDSTFDELVKKTIEKASPMPVFPVAMAQESVTLGFNFTPGNLGNR